MLDLDDNCQGGFNNYKKILKEITKLYKSCQSET
jgi:hypothetical protein